MMSQSEKKFLEKWEKILQKGRLHYHLFYGTLWAVFFFVFMGLFDLADDTPFGEAFFSQKALLKLLVWEVTGVALYSQIMWYDGNRRYKGLMKKLNDGQKPS